MAIGYMQNAGVTSLGFMPGYDEPKLVLGLYLNAVVVGVRRAALRKEPGMTLCGD